MTHGEDFALSLSLVDWMDVPQNICVFSGASNFWALSFPARTMVDIVLVKEDQFRESAAPEGRRWVQLGVNEGIVTCVRERLSSQRVTRYWGRADKGGGEAAFSAPFRRALVEEEEKKCG